jgi:hypothetical protein
VLLSKTLIQEFALKDTFLSGLSNLRSEAAIVQVLDAATRLLGLPAGFEGIDIRPGLLADDDCSVLLREVLASRMAHDLQVMGERESTYVLMPFLGCWLLQRMILYIHLPFECHTACSEDIL